jgi:hypothetical protein
MHDKSLSLKKAIAVELPEHLENIWLPEMSNSKLSDRLVQIVCEIYDFNYRYPGRYISSASKIWQEIILETEFNLWERTYHRLKLIRVKDWIDKRVSRFFHGFRNIVDNELIYLKIAQMPTIVEEELDPITGENSLKNFNKIIGILLYLYIQKCKEEVDNVTFNMLSKIELAIVKKFEVFSFTF